MVNRIKTVLATLKYLKRYGPPSHLISFGESLGDNLILTTLTRELRNRGYKNIWVKCNHADLFRLNPDIRLVLPYRSLLSSVTLKVFNVQVRHISYSTFDPLTDRDTIPEKHIILKMADCISLKGQINNKPVFVLSKDEEAMGVYNSRQLVITTSGMNAVVPMRNKEWLVERYQNIVDNLKNDYTIIQLGSLTDYPLNGVTDLRGKTSVRESAAILKNSKLLISHVGFMMHLSRAVDCKAVIIYGGRESPLQSGYNCFTNIYNKTPCSPCWLRNRCDYDRRCMTEINSEIVEQAIRTALLKSSEPLAIEKLIND